MCDPASIAYAVVAVGSATASVVSQKRTAKAQGKAMTAQAEARSEELSMKASAEAGTRVRQARAERARMRVSAGEAGLSGQSFELSMLDSFEQQNQDVGAIQAQALIDGRSSQAQSDAGFASISQIGTAEAGLQIAGAGLQGYKAGQSLQGFKGQTAAPAKSRSANSTKNIKG